MTDLEMIKKCAEKMVEAHVYRDVSFYDPDTPSIVYADGTGADYDPLHDDAQAMALVKKFSLIIEPTDVVDGIGSATDWWVQAWINDEVRWKGVENKDLNRAIVECVAKM